MGMAAGPEDHQELHTDALLRLCCAHGVPDNRAQQPVQPQNLMQRTDQQHRLG